MKKILLLFVCAAAAVFGQTNSEPRVTAIDGYAAQVDNEIITYGDVRTHIAPQLQQAMQQLRGQALAAQMQQLLINGRESLIEEKLIAEEAKNAKFQMPSHVIDEEVKTIIRDRFDGSRALLTKALISQRMTYEEWRESIADQLLVRIYYNQEVLQKVHITDDAVKAEYERVKDELRIPFRVKYRYILINKGSSEEDQAVKRKQAEDTLKKLQDGADFLTVAKEISEGDTDLSPWRDPADVKEVMRPALRRTPAGEISDLIEDDNVFYIIYVESRQEEGLIPFEDVRERIQQSLFDAERQGLHDELVQRLSAKHYIKRY